jgi:hypothetical protein
LLDFGPFFNLDARNLNDLDLLRFLIEECMIDFILFVSYFLVETMFDTKLAKGDIECIPDQHIYNNSCTFSAASFVYGNFPNGCDFFFEFEEKLGV